MSNKQQTYKGNGNHKWEGVTTVVSGAGRDHTARLRVPGGWLYQNVTIINGEVGTNATMVFVPLPAVLVQGKGDSSKGKHAL